MYFGSKKNDPIWWKERLSISMNAFVFPSIMAELLKWIEKIGLILQINLLVASNLWEVIIDNFSFHQCIQGIENEFQQECNKENKLELSSNAYQRGFLAREATGLMPSSTCIPWKKWLQLFSISLDYRLVDLDYIDEWLRMWAKSRRRSTRRIAQWNWVDRFHQKDIR
jgi:hypothetical protein